MKTFKIGNRAYRIQESKLLEDDWYLIRVESESCLLTGSLYDCIEKAKMLLQDYLFEV